MISPLDWVLLGRAALATALGFIIGWERERSGHAAGQRTFALIALGSAAFTALGTQTFLNAADRIVSGIVTGIGFLGAGVILRHSTGEIRGLTTAATVWTVAALGVLVGTGRYVPGVLLTVLILCLLTWERLPILSQIGHKNKSHPPKHSQDE